MSYVLIVDDDPNMARAIADMVSLFDWKTHIVHGPGQAIKVLHLEKKPALVLLDLNMDGVNGLEVCKYIKRDPLTGNPEVVFVTAEDDPTFVKKAKEAGAMDYLVKPVDIDKLESILDNMLASSKK